MALINRAVASFLKRVLGEELWIYKKGREKKN